MKKAFIALLCTGCMFFAAAHPFNTLGALILGDREAEISVWGGTDFNDPRVGDIGIGMYYGIGDRVQIGFENYWWEARGVIINEEGETGRKHGWATPGIIMDMAIRPDFMAVKAWSALDGSAFSGLLCYTFALKSSETELNLDLGFGGSAWAEDASVFLWSYSVVQPIGNFFVGGEVFGAVGKDWDKDDKKPEWQIGLGYTFGRNEDHTISAGFGGSFVSNDDLALTIGMTKFFGGK